MKRTLTIILVFIIISVFFITGCTVTCDGESCRGLGYEVLSGCYNIFNCAVGGDPSKNRDYDLAVQGEHYGEPKAYVFYYNDDDFVLNFDVEIYEKISHISYEICIIQDGVLLYTHSEELYSVVTNINVQKTIKLPKYNLEGGMVECIINKFEAYNEK